MSNSSHIGPHRSRADLLDEIEQRRAACTFARILCHNITLTQPEGEHTEAALELHHLLTRIGNKWRPHK
jgi:hypothetical protein